MPDGDDAKIRNLIASLAQQADSGEVDSYVSLFTDDAVWEMPGNPMIDLPADRREGRPDIAAGVRARRAAGVQGPGSHSLHVITTMRVDIDGDSALVHSYWQYFTSTATNPTLSGIGQYRDTVRRTPEGWKLAHRTVMTG